MAFDRGSVSFARFRVIGGPSAVSHDLLDALRENVIKPPPVGTPPEVQAGWVAGRHVLDTGFDPEVNVFGERVQFGLRLDTHRVPAEIRRAYRAEAEAVRAADGPTGFASRAERREAIEEADDRCRRELAAGRHVRTRHVPLVWDVPRRLVLAPVFSDTVGATLRDLFADTFDARLEPLSSGALAREIVEARGRTRDYEDLAPTAITPPPAAARGEEGRSLDVPAVPWCFGGPEPKDFLGNEMLVWLWAQAETGSAVIRTGAGEVAFAIDSALDMDCAWDVTGKMTLRAEGPTRAPEAAAALRSGKWPRKAGLIVAASGSEWTLSFQADRFLVTGARLPRPEDPPASPREAVEERLESLEALDRALVGLFTAFLERRLDPGWASERAHLREWAARRGRDRRAPADVGMKAGSDAGVARPIAS